MIFSKSFGYTVRGILFIASMQQEKQFIQVEEIAGALSVPRHFMGKILKKLAKENMLSSVKGPCGGFTINENTLHITLLQLVKLTDGAMVLENCVMRLKECNSSRPCPMHSRMNSWRAGLKSMLADTCIKDLLQSDIDQFVKSLSDLQTD
jgi:Rrf2 family protein